MLLAHLVKVELVIVDSEIAISEIGDLSRWTLDVNILTYSRRQRASEQPGQVVVLPSPITSR
jgi:hypothetical protein